MEGTTPAAEGTTPAAEGTTPAAESTTPAAESTTPAAESTTPAAESTTPAAESTTPAAESTTPAAETFSDLTYPENSIVDEELQAAFLEVAKEAGITKQQAQQLVDVGAKMQATMLARLESEHQQKIEDWVTSARQDKEFGGAKFDENLAIAKTAFNEFSSPELITILNETGLANNPEVIRHFYRLGKSMSNDTLFKSGNGAGSGINPAQTLYDK